MSALGPGFHPPVPDVHVVSLPSTLAWHAPGFFSFSLFSYTCCLGFTSWYWLWFAFCLPPSHPSYISFHHIKIYFCHPPPQRITQYSWNPYSHSGDRRSWPFQAAELLFTAGPVPLWSVLPLPETKPRVLCVAGALWNSACESPWNHLLLLRLLHFPRWSFSSPIPFGTEWLSWSKAEGREAGASGSGFCWWSAHGTRALPHVSGHFTQFSNWLCLLGKMYMGKWLHVIDEKTEGRECQGLSPGHMGTRALVWCVVLPPPEGPGLWLVFRLCIWERLQPEQTPELGAPIQPPTESAGSWVLPRDPPPPRVPLRALSSEEGAFSGAFSQQNFSSFFGLHSAQGCGAGAGLGVRLDQTQPDAGSETSLSASLSQDFSPRNPTCLPSPAFSVDLCVWVSMCIPAPDSGLSPSSECSWPQLTWPLGGSVA